MSTFIIKLIAMILMFFDHFASILIEKDTLWYNIIRSMGRIAMPLFCFFIVEGFRKTSSKKRYILRILIGAILSIIPYRLFSDSLRQNVMFTLLFGLISLIIIDYSRNKSKIIKIGAIFLILLILVLVTIINTNYYFWGILLIIGYYYSDNFTKSGKIKILIFTLIFSSMLLIEKGFINLMYNFGLVNTKVSVDIRSIRELFAIFSIIPIYLYNGKLGYKPKTKTKRKIMQLANYLFYPLHLMVLYIIACLLHIR